MRNLTRWGITQRGDHTWRSTQLIALTGMVTAVGSVVGTISTIILAWRADRRTARESELKLLQLQQQIRELELKLPQAPDIKRKEAGAS